MVFIRGGFKLSRAFGIPKPYSTELHPAASTSGSPFGTSFKQLLIDTFPRLTISSASQSHVAAGTNRE